MLDLSFSETKAGSAMGKLGDTQAGLLLLRSGVAKQETLIAKDPRHVLLYSHLAGSYTLLANCLLDSADRKTAIEYYRKAVAARLAFSEKSPTSNRRALAECYANLAKVLETGDRAEAIKQYGNAIEVLEHLTSSDGTNALSRIARADALSSAARLYVRMAELGGEPSSRLEYWKKARSFYQHSEQLWMELQSTGKLPSTRRGAVREVSAELARCDDSLAKLEPTH
jgi:tetratricopeptide (TPR) repeat protein